MARRRTYESIYMIVAEIPRGRVATYGQIAELAGLGRAARQVGYALGDLPDGGPVPWHRVVNAQGKISVRSETGAEGIQRRLLEREGVIFGAGRRISLERFRWRPA